MEKRNFLIKIHPEMSIDGFNQNDGTVKFYGFVRACLLQTNAKKVMDFGAGRGAFYYINTAEDGSLLRRYLQDLRTAGVEVTACDVDSVVLEHPCSDHQVKIGIDEKLPFDDNTFDVILSDHTFEHIENPAQVGSELLRVLKPSGYICARTPSKYGYVALVASLIPNRFHAKILGRIQPDRMKEDVFPTAYKLNTLGAVKRYFPRCEVAYYYFSGEPSYFFGNRIIYSILRILHRVLFGSLNASFCVFIRKPAQP